MTVPDFHKAQFSLCEENPFRLTPPGAQATLNADRHSSANKSANSTTEQNYPDPSFSSMTNSELMLIKKSIFVTVFACLAAFAVGTVCWLILNIAIGAFLHSMGVHYVIVPLVLLAINVNSIWTI